MAPPSTRSWSTPFEPSWSRRSAELALHLERWVDAGPFRCPTEHHPQRLLVGWVPLQSHGEGRIVGSHRAGAHEHRVALCPEAMDVLSRGLAGDPPARAIGCSGPAVEARGHLQHHVRSPRPAVGEVRGELLLHLRGAGSEADLDARIAQHPETGPADVRIGILHPHDDAGHTRLDHRLRARRGQTVVRAGLERAVEGRTHRARACRLERHDLGVPSLSTLRRTLEAPGVDDGTDPRAGRGAAAHRGRELDGPPHQALVVGLGHCTLRRRGWSSSPTTGADSDRPFYVGARVATTCCSRRPRLRIALPACPGTFVGVAGARVVIGNWRRPLGSRSRDPQHRDPPARTRRPETWPVQLRRGPRSPRWLPGGRLRGRPALDGSRVLGCVPDQP